MSTLSVTNDNFSIYFLLSNQVQYFIPLSRRSRKIKLNFFFFLIFIFFGISSVASLLYSFLISKDEIQLHFYIHITVFNIDNINDIWWRKKVINCKRPPFENKKLTLLTWLRNMLGMKIMMMLMKDITKKKEYICF